MSDQSTESHSRRILTPTGAVVQFLLLTVLGWVSTLASIGVILGLVRVGMSVPFILLLAGIIVAAAVPIVALRYPADRPSLSARVRIIHVALWLVWLAASVPGWLYVWSWGDEPGPGAGFVVIFLLPCILELALVPVLAGIDVVRRRLPAAARLTSAST